MMDQPLGMMLLAAAAIAGLVISVLVWAFWTAPYIRKKKSRSAPWWAWFSGTAVFYDYLTACRLNPHRRRLRLQVQGLALLVFLLATAALLACWTAGL